MAKPKMFIENLKQKANQAMLEMRVKEGYENALNRAISQLLDWITYNCTEDGELPSVDQYSYGEIVGSQRLLEQLIDLSERGLKK